MSARLHAVAGGTRPAVEVTELRKTYPGGVQAVRGVDFRVAPGEVFGLLGHRSPLMPAKCVSDKTYRQAGM